ncbi:MAG: efflux RND transporter periplasmic adaptor subunit [Halanaerobium sp.]
MKNKIIILIALIICILSLGVSAAEVVETTESLRDDISLNENLTGTINAAKSVNVPIELSGVADEVLVDIGDRVEKDQELVILDQEKLKVQKKNAEAALAGAQANYQQLLNGATAEELKRAEASYQEAEENLKSAETNLKLMESIFNEKRSLKQQFLNAEQQLDGAEQQLKSSEENLKQAETNFEQAERAFQRAEKLYNDDVISKKDFEDAESAYKNADSNLNNAKSAVVQAERSLKTTEELYRLSRENYNDPIELEQQLENARSQYKSAQTNLKVAEANLSEIKRGAREEQRRASLAQVRQAEAGLEEVEVNLEDSIIKSPIAGTVSQLNVESGELVSAGQQLLKIIDLEELLVEIYLTAESISRINLGDKVNVKPEIMQHFIEGEISSISPEADLESRTYRVEVKIDNPGQRIKAGMFAAVELNKGSSGDAVVVPIDSIVDLNTDSPYLFVFENNRAVRKDIEIGIITDTQVEILDGLNAGEKVIINGQNRIEPNAEVEVINR